MPLLEVNGSQLHYEDTGGDGPPIVFAHGLLWSGRMYEKQVAALRARHRCITYDHRGQGQSPASTAPYGMETLFRDAAALIEKLEAKPCHFVGLSMGGFVGMRLAARRPELLRSLVLIDTAADREPALNVPKYRMMALVARLFGYAPLIKPIMKIMCARSFREDPSRADERQRLEDHLLQLREVPTRAALEAVITRRAVKRELPEINLPTLILHGAEDSAITLKRARQLEAGIAGSRFIEIPHAGHTSTVEEPEAINRALADFFGD
jgi:3-oxoadipate enol-lactonase